MLCQATRSHALPSSVYIRPMSRFWPNPVTLPNSSIELGARGPFAKSESKLSDRDIRRALATGDGPLSRLRTGCTIEEVRCCRGYVRADYLVSSKDSLAIIEVKSDCDSLRRFDEQVRVYSSIADRVILVVGWVWAVHALRAVPWWWEVWLAERPPMEETRFIPLRDGANNPGVEPSALASMLPSDEVRRLARDTGVSIAGSRHRQLRELIATRVSCTDLRLAVHDWLGRLPDQRAKQAS